MRAIAPMTITGGTQRRVRRPGIPAALIASLVSLAAPNAANADAGGVSFWLPGSFGSLAATPAQPGWSLGTIYYHSAVEAAGGVSAARALHIGRFNPTLSINLQASLDARADLVFLAPTYVFAQPVWGGQFALSLLAGYGRSEADIQARVTGALGAIGFGAAREITDSRTAFTDLFVQPTLKWNQGVHNYMIYGMTNLPVGAYDATRLVNLGLGHWSADGGFGYTYFDPTKGHEFSFVTGATYNFENPDTKYQNGIDWHLDWGLSQFLSKQVHVGAVGYFYNQLTGDSGEGARLGDFKSRVMGIGPQIGFLFPVGDMQGYLNLKGYKEFEAEHRPEGWSVWVTFAVSPAEKHAAGVSPKPTIRK